MLDGTRLGETVPCWFECVYRLPEKGIFHFCLTLLSLYVTACCADIALTLAFNSWYGLDTSTETAQHLVSYMTYQKRNDKITRPYFKS